VLFFCRVNTDEKYFDNRFREIGIFLIASIFIKLVKFQFPKITKIRWKKRNFDSYFVSTCFDRDLSFLILDIHLYSIFNIYLKKNSIYIYIYIYIHMLSDIKSFIFKLLNDNKKFLIIKIALVRQRNLNLNLNLFCTSKDR